MSDSEGNTQVDQTTPPVQVGSRTGQVKAFNAKKGYGFIRCRRRNRYDVFVHQTNINPLHNLSHSRRGEYVSFD